MQRILTGLVVMAVVWLPAFGAAAGTIGGTVQAVGLEHPEDIVISVEGIEGSFSPSQEPHVMDQRGKVFIPFILPMLKGEQVRFLNSDPFLHNIHPYLGRKSLFNVAVPSGGKPITKTFNDVGEIVILCNVHPEMEAWIVVRENPYFAVTDAEGKYQIQDVPAGTYTVTAWHPKLKEGACSTAVATEGEVSCDFELRLN